MRVSVWIYRSTWWMIVGMKSIILRLAAPFVLFTCWNACNYVLASFQKVCIKSKQKFQLCNPIADCKSNLRDLRNFHASIPISHTIETPKVFCNHLTPETVQFRLAKLKHLTGNWLHWGTISIHHHPQTVSFSLSIWIATLGDYRYPSSSPDILFSLSIWLNSFSNSAHKGLYEEGRCDKFCRNY